MTIGEIIKEIRDTYKYSQSDLAQILGVSQKAISNWEANNDKPNAYSLLMIYEKFNITPNEMLGIEEIETSKIRINNSFNNFNNTNGNIQIGNKNKSK